MRETIAYTLMAFLAVFVVLLLVLWLRKRRKVHEAIWGKRRVVQRPRRPGVEEDKPD